MTVKEWVTQIDGNGIVGQVRAAAAEKHPATFSGEILEVAYNELQSLTWPGARVLDPFGGHGYVHALGEWSREYSAAKRLRTTMVEIEAEWCAYAIRTFGDDDVDTATFCGDSTRLPRRWARKFGAVFTSPCYGNRMADSHTARDSCSNCRGTGSVPTGEYLDMPCSKCGGSGLSPRRSYTHDLGHALEPNNAGAMQWGDEYRALHEQVWAEVWRVLKPNGIFLLNVKDHVRDRKRVHVSAWHRRTVEKLGFVRESTITVPLAGMRFGENHEARVPNEYVYVFRKPKP